MEHGSRVLDNTVTDPARSNLMAESKSDPVSDVNGLRIVRKVAGDLIIENSVR